MTTGPKLHTGKTLVPGLLAVGLFGLMALIVLNTSFQPMADGGFEADSIVAALGYALLDLEALQQREGVPGTEPFLAAFLLIAVALDAALDASLVLAKREEQGEPVAALSSTGAGPDDAGPGAGPAPDSSGFGRSEPSTATDGGGSGSGSGSGSSSSAADADADSNTDADTDTDVDSASTGGEDR